jgi:hypothetical protein
MSKEEKQGNVKTCKKYSQTELKSAVNALWNITQRLRTQSEDKWSIKMAALAKQINVRHSNVPLSTLKDHFKKRLHEARLSPKALQANESKSRSDARSFLTGREKRSLYDWIEYMRQRYTPPTRLEVRCQVLSIFEKCIHSSIKLKTFVQTTLAHNQNKSIH